MEPSHRVALLTALAVLGAGGAWAAAPAGAPAPASAPATVPAQLPGYSYLTGSMGAAPPGRVLALYQQGLGVEFMDVPQALTVGADGASARRARTALDRGAPDTQGDAAPMALSGDGSTIAVGDWDTSTPGASAGGPGRADVALVDAATGDVRTLALPDARAVLPLAWSPDARRLAYLSPTEAADPFASPTDPAGDLLVLDVGSGRARPVPDVDDAVSAAFSPDGRLLAVQRSGGAVEVRAGDGALLRTLVPPRAGDVLAAGAAFSPDGRLLGLQRAGEVVFLPVADDPAVAVPAPVAGDALLAWRSPGEVLVQDRGASSSATSTDFTVSSVELATGSARAFTRVPTAGGNYAVTRFELATGLVQGARWTAAVPRPDRGRPAAVLRVGGVLLSAAAAALVAQRLTRRRSARRVPAPAARPAPRPVHG